MIITVGPLSIEVRRIKGITATSSPSQVLRDGVLQIPHQWPDRRQARAVIAMVMLLIRRVNREADPEVDAELVLRFLEENYGVRIFEPFWLFSPRA